MTVTSCLYLFNKNNSTVGFPGKWEGQRNVAHKRNGHELLVKSDIFGYWSNNKVDFQFFLKNKALFKILCIILLSAAVCIDLCL